MPSGVTSSTVAPSGKFLMLSVRSYSPQKSTVSAYASTVGIGVIVPASIVTFTFTDTSSFDPSGYVTTTVASFVPSVVVSTGYLNSYFVPSGRSPLFVITSSAFGVSPFLTEMSSAVGLFISACESPTVTFTTAVSFVPSG